VTAPPIVRGRTITGMSAVLLPFDATGAIDWPAFRAHLARTVASGLIPAVNMDTGFGPLLAPSDRAAVMTIAATTCGPRGFLAGAQVADELGAPFALEAYQREFAAIVAAGGAPIVFPSFGLAALGDDELVAAHQRLAAGVDRFYGFELGSMFHPAGRIYSLDVFESLLDIPELVGLKHSSLDRAQEWRRLEIRDRRRPGFRLLTGNDLAIDMVIYGSDYLLGLSTFAPDAFAARDAAWFAGDDARFWALNDLLQYLGQFAFRAPVPGYRHNAAMFLHARGLIGSDGTHPSSPPRPGSDRQILGDIAARLAALL
jgi:dihydrodipicolinate synthase/N-acetylneuraminate lyase